MFLTYEDQLLLFGSNPYLSNEEETRFKEAFSKLKDHETWLQRANSLRVSSGTFLNLVKSDLSDSLPISIRSGFEARYQVNCSHIQNLHRELQTILPDLHKRLRGFRALKGVQLGLTIYPQQGFREMRDIDLLIYPEDIPILKQIFIEHGYVQGIVDKECCEVIPLPSKAIEQAEATHYELVHFQKIIPVPDFDLVEHLVPSKIGPRFFTSKGQTYSIISFDIHHNLAPDFQVEELWHRCEDFMLEAETIKGQSHEDLLWFLAARLYHETMLFNFPHLVLLQDMNAILFKHASKIDWDYLIRLVEKYDLQPSLFYTLSHLRMTFGRDIPQFVLERMSPEQPDVLRYHEWGDFLPKLFGKCEVCLVEFQS